MGTGHTDEHWATTTSSSGDVEGQVCDYPLKQQPISTPKISLHTKLRPNNKILVSHQNKMRDGVFSMLMDVLLTIKGAILKHQQLEVYQIYLLHFSERMYKKVPFRMIRILFITCYSEKCI